MGEVCRQPSLFHGTRALLELSELDISPAQAGHELARFWARHRRSLGRSGLGLGIGGMDGD